MAGGVFGDPFFEGGDDEFVAFRIGDFRAGDDADGEEAFVGVWADEVAFFFGGPLSGKEAF